VADYSKNLGENLKVIHESESEAEVFEKTERLPVFEKLIIKVESI